MTVFTLPSTLIMTDIFNSIYVVSETAERLKKAQDKFDDFDFAVNLTYDESGWETNESFWAEYIFFSEDDDEQY